MSISFRALHLEVYLRICLRVMGSRSIVTTYNKTTDQRVGSYSITRTKFVAQGCQHFRGRYYSLLVFLNRISLFQFYDHSFHSGLFECIRLPNESVTHHLGDPPIDVARTNCTTHRLPMRIFRSITEEMEDLISAVLFEQRERLGLLDHRKFQIITYKK